MSDRNAGQKMDFVESYSNKTGLLDHRGRVQYATQRNIKVDKVVVGRSESKQIIRHGVRW